MSRLERKLRTIDPRALYTRRRKNSADTMLLQSLQASESILPICTLNNENKVISTIAETTPSNKASQSAFESQSSSINNYNNSITGNTESSTVKLRSESFQAKASPSNDEDLDDDKQQPKTMTDNHRDATQETIHSVKSLPPPIITSPAIQSSSSSSSFSHVSRWTNRHNKNDAIISSRLSSTPTKTATMTRDTATPAKQTSGKSVLVNLGVANYDNDSRRLSKLLREVNEMREIRDRHDSFATEQSLEANIIKNEALELQRITKIQRSKKLLFKYKVYDFLKRPASFGAMVYHVFAFILVAASLILSVYPALENQIGKLDVLDILEKTVLFWFTTEYILMLWASDCRPQYQGIRGKIAFVKSPAHLIDLLVIILSAALPSISSHDGHEVFAFRAFRGFHRFFQVLQVIALKRQLRPWQLFLSVLYDQREQLLIIFYLEIVLLCMLSYLGFLVEHETNSNLENIADAMWWSVVTLTTVGYGDKVPETWPGKVISGCFILFGVAVFALPAGIIGAGLALKLEEVERSRQRRLKKEAAAKLIQRTWQAYRANYAYYELSAFFRHRPGDLFKGRVYDKIMKAFVALVRFHIAKSAFKELTRPVDLRNVIESYKYGQMDIFSRLKQLNSALDIIISRMSMAENERIIAINQLAKKLEQLEMNSNVGIAGITGSIESTCLAGSGKNLAMRYLDLINIPPMPQTSTHPSTIPLRARPHSHQSHNRDTYISPSQRQHQQPQYYHSHHYNTPHHPLSMSNNYLSSHQHCSTLLNVHNQPQQQQTSNYSDHTITTITEDVPIDQPPPPAPPALPPFLQKTGQYILPFTFNEDYRSSIPFIDDPSVNQQRLNKATSANGKETKENGAQSEKHFRRHSMG